MAATIVNTKSYYVYLYRDPRPGKDFSPIYVGKGKPKDRATSHWTRGSHNPVFNRVLAKIRSMRLKPIIEILAWFDSQNDAHALEVALISRYGRRDRGTGTLCNLTDGGEGTAGLIHSDEHKAKVLKKVLASKPIRSGKMKRHWADPEYRGVHGPNVGAATSAAWADQERRAARVANMRLSRQADAVATGERSRLHHAKRRPAILAARLAKSIEKADERDRKRADTIAMRAEEKALAKLERLQSAPARMAAGNLARSASIKAYRANADPDVLALHNLHVKQAKLADGDKTSAQVKAYYTSATPEQLAAHAAAISATKTADAERIGQKSEEVWNRPGMNELISASIAVGQTSAWADPEKKARRIAKLHATYAAKRARKAAEDKLL